MKEKIKIMKQKQQPSDEEIQSYMNFDRLLDSRKIAMGSTRNLAVLKWIIPALTITAVAVWFFLAKDEASSVMVLEESKTQTDTSQYFQRIPPANLPDSIKDKHQARLAIPEDKNKLLSDAKALKPDVEKQVATKGSETPAKESEYVQAEPALGYSDLYNFFNAHLKYPSEGLQDSTQGVQTISFVINTMGKPEQIAVVNSLGEPFDKESKRLIENMPAWKPATLNGKPVPSKISLPITFQIQKIKN